MIIKLPIFKIFSNESFGRLLAIFIASQIIFPISENIYISNIINVVLLAYFILYFILTKRTSIEINYFIIGYGSFVIIAFASILWSVDVQGTSKVARTAIILLIDLILIYNISKIFNVSNYILFGILIGAFANYLIAFGIVDYQTNYVAIGRFVGTTDNPNGTAIFMIFSLFSSLILLKQVKQQVWKILLYLNIFLSEYTIFLTASRKGILFGLLLIFVFLFKSIFNIRQFIVIGIIGSILIFTFLSEDVQKATGFDKRLDSVVSKFTEMGSTLEGSNTGGSASERLKLIHIGVDLFQENPLLGTGMATFFKLGKVGLYSHNNYIELLVGVGLIGTVIFYLIYIMLLNKIMVNKIEEKFIFIIFILGILLMDMALVSYVNKLLLFILLFISIYIERDQNRVEK